MNLKDNKVKLYKKINKSKCLYLKKIIKNSIFEYMFLNKIAKKYMYDINSNKCLL